MIEQNITLKAGNFILVIGVPIDTFSTDEINQGPVLFLLAEEVRLIRTILPSVQLIFHLKNLKGFVKEKLVELAGQNKLVCFSSPTAVRNALGCITFSHALQESKSEPVWKDVVPPENKAHPLQRTFQNYQLAFTSLAPLWTERFARLRNRNPEEAPKEHSHHTWFNGKPYNNIQQAIWAAAQAFPKATAKSLQSMVSKANGDKIPITTVAQYLTEWRKILREGQQKTRPRVVEI